jgi:hypothetical protein
MGLKWSAPNLFAGKFTAIHTENPPDVRLFLMYNEYRKVWRYSLSVKDDYHDSLFTDPDNPPYEFVEILAALKGNSDD